jgi:hypothetical protein
MSEEIWVGINDERVQLEGEALNEFIAQRDAYLEAKKEAEEIALAKKAVVKAALLDRLGITEDEAKLLLP